MFAPVRFVDKPLLHFSCSLPLFCPSLTTCTSSMHVPSCWYSTWRSLCTKEEKDFKVSWPQWLRISKWQSELNTPSAKGFSCSRPKCNEDKKKRRRSKDQTQTLQALQAYSTGSIGVFLLCSPNHQSHPLLRPFKKSENELLHDLRFGDTLKARYLIGSFWHTCLFDMFALRWRNIWRWVVFPRSNSGSHIRAQSQPSCPCLHFSLRYPLQSDRALTKHESKLGMERLSQF